MRHEIIGPTPRSRNDFDPLNFLEKVFGNDDEFIVLDSNNLDASWRKDIQDVNEGTEFHREKCDESVRNIVTQFHLDESETCSANQANTEVNEKDLPKRVLIYTSKKLLARLSLNLKCSVDGTFKSSSKLWAQQFIMMSKSKGYWIPTCFGWLPDKSEISYKVFFLITPYMQSAKCKILHICTRASFNFLSRPYSYITSYLKIRCSELATQLYISFSLIK